MSKTTHTDEFEYKGRKVILHTEYGGAITPVTRGYWKFTHEGKEYGVSVDTQGEDHVGLSLILFRDARFFIDDPEEYDRMAAENEKKDSEARADRRVLRREENEEYRDIVDRAIEECGEGVESYLQEVWDFWADG